MSVNGHLAEADIETFGVPKAPVKPVSTTARITAAKLDHWDDQAATNARLIELGKEQQAAQEKLEAVQQKHQQRFAVEAKPLNMTLERVNKEVQQLTADFQQREAERNAYIRALEKTAGNDGRDDPT